MRDIKGFEGQYAITEDGQVWSYKTNKFLALSTDKDGYKRITLYKKDGSTQRFGVHRLVREAYIPNPENKPTVNHNDENKQNNHVSNLCWMTMAEQNMYGTKVKRTVETRRKNDNYNYGHPYYGGGRKPGIPVYCVELNKTFDGATIAAKELGLDQGSITKCCQGKRNHHGGYHWRYAEVI